MQMFLFENTQQTKMIYTVVISKKKGKEMLLLGGEHSRFHVLQ